MPKVYLQTPEPGPSDLDFALLPWSPPKPLGKLLLKTLGGSAWAGASLGRVVQGIEQRCLLAIPGPSEQEVDGLPAQHPFKRPRVGAVGGTVGQPPASQRLWGTQI